MNEDIASRMYPSQVAANPTLSTPQNASSIPPRASGKPYDDLAARMFPAPQGEPVRATAPDSDRPATDIASRMYPGEIQGDSAHNEQNNVQSGTQASDELGDQLSVDEALSVEESVAERMYAEGGPVLDSAEAYSGATLAATFDQLEHQARHDQNEADIEALANGRREASELLFEWSVPADHAHEIATELSSWHDRWMRDELPDMDKITENGVKAHRELRKTWGRQYDANLAFARTAYQQAAKRLPWLSDLVEAGAGNSAVLIKQFAAIGRRQARAAKNSQKQTGNRR